MKAQIQRLRAEVRSDRESFAARVEEIEGLALDVEHPPDGDVARAALALHHAYSAVEAVLERVARTVEGGLPEGPDWHRALLESMALDIEGIRPRVLDRSTKQLLTGLLGFRHFLRHAYSVPLDPVRLARLRADALAVAPLLERDLDALDAFLADLAERVD